MKMIEPKKVREFAEMLIDESTIHSIVQWVANNMLPEDVFPEDELADCAKDWATDNGWIDPKEAYPHWDRMTDEEKDEAIRKAY